MIRFGIIGCGFIAKKHVETIAKFPNIKLTAVSDVSFKPMKQLVTKYRIHLVTTERNDIKFYTDYQSLLNNPDIDIVLVSVYSGLHAKITKAALQKRKHVLLEKPLALSLQDAIDIENIGKTENKDVFIAHQMRYRPLLQMIKQLICENFFGKIHYGSISLRLNRSTDYFKASNWKGTWEKDGGMLINQGIHFIDLLIWFLGDIDAVYGSLQRTNKQKEIEDIAMGILHFKDGTKGIIEANTITKPANSGYGLSLFGDKGTLIIGGKQLNRIEHAYFENEPHVENLLMELADNTDEQIFMYEDILQRVISKKRPFVSPREGTKALETIFALYDSHKKQQKITLPLERFSTKTMSVDNHKDEENVDD